MKFFLLLVNIGTSAIPELLINQYKTYLDEKKDGISFC